MPQQPPWPQATLPFINVLGKEREREVWPTYPWLRRVPFNENCFSPELMALYVEAVFRFNVTMDILYTCIIHKYVVIVFIFFIIIIFVFYDDTREDRGYYEKTVTEVKQLYTGPVET